MGTRNVRWAVAVTLALWLPTAMAWPAAVLATTTTISMWTTPASPADYGPITLHATVTPDEIVGDAPYGTVTWYRSYAPGYWTDVASVPLVAGQSEVSSDPIWFDPGTHTLRAEFRSDHPDYQSSGSDWYVLEVGPVPTSISLSGPGSWEAHTLVELTWQVTKPSWDNGTVAVFEVGQPASVCEAPASGWQPGGSCAFITPGVGTYQYYATYSGGDQSLPSESQPFTLTLTPDLVHASNVTVQYSTFYPVRDGYRDTVKVSGIRDEELSATIKIYRPSGAVIKTVQVTKGLGAYAYTWNGRRADGSVYPEGSYRFVQTLVDEFGNAKSWTSYVKLSKKKLIWHSSSITKKGSAVTSAGHYGAGSVAANTSTGVLRLKAPTPWVDWAGAGWQFTLPSAVSYKGLKFKVYVKHTIRMGSADLGAQDFSICPYTSGTNWYEGCFAAWKHIWNDSGTVRWFSTVSLGSNYRAGLKVRGTVTTDGPTVYVYKARIVFKYATLGY